MATSRSCRSLAPGERFGHDNGHRASWRGATAFAVKVIVAVERREKDKIMTRDRIVAGRSFGFWSGLFGPRCEELWRHRPRRAFPLAKERKDLSARTEAFRRFRNRLAHHNSILFQPVAAPHDDMLEIAGFIDPAARHGCNSLPR
jgi:hypothetical protein